MLAAAAVLATLGCSGEALHRPSVLLFVLDTTRADAVSAYGRVTGTTPTVDRLAAAGLRFANAYAQAPWTLPSHATLFTALLPSQHGVGWQAVRASDGLTMLAERFRDVGYETVGISENPWISDSFNLTQGFERFTPSRGETVRLVTEWLRRRRDGRPFFLFVNVADAHAPYAVRTRNVFLERGVTVDQAAAVAQDPEEYFCPRTPRESELEILWGLYLGDVLAADEQLEGVLAALRQGGLAKDLLTVVTSDHGEHFGEHGLVSHQFTLREEALRVPLVVHGLAGVAPAVIETPVRLADVAPSLLRWAGIPALGDVAARPLPTDAQMPDEPAPVAAEFYDLRPIGETGGNPFVSLVSARQASMRRHCDPSERVFGDMRTLVRYPFKLVWYARYRAELYDLSADRGEQHDLGAARPTVVAALTRELEGLTAYRPAPPTAAALPEVLPDTLERLRALGYVGDDVRRGAAR